jgi:hypothetical protein
LAKKPPERRLKNILRKYLSSGTTIGPEIKNPKIDFGFRFAFPKGKDKQGKPMGRPFSLVKEKKWDHFEIISPTTISPNHIKILNSMKENKQKQLFSDLKKVFNLKGFLYDIDIPNKRFAIIDAYFLEDNKDISKNELYRIIRNIFGIIIYSITLIQELCAGPGDISPSRKLDPSLYV